MVVHGGMGGLWTRGKILGPNSYLGLVSHCRFQTAAFQAAYRDAFTCWDQNVFAMLCHSEGADLKGKVSDDGGQWKITSALR